MRFFRSRQRSVNRYNQRLRFEPLERRDLMSGNVISITSGTTYSFRDADGTKVNVKLMGSGSGQMTLTNGLLTGGAIDTLEITGTTATSQLKITASGGVDGVSTINNLTVWSALDSQTALKQFTGSGMNLAPNGEMLFYGKVDNFTIDNVGVNASIDVDGTIGSFTATAMHAYSSLAADGMIGALNITNMGVESDVATPQIGKLKVTGLANGAEIVVGIGGIQSAFFQNVVSSNVYTWGNIGPLVIQASSAGSAVAANRSPGSDGVFGTLDDFTLGGDAAVGSIGTVTLNGAVGTGANALQLIATGKVGQVTVPPNQQKPEIVDKAISRFIPLEIAQAVASATGFEDDEIWIAVFGQEIEIPAPGAAASKGPTYYLDASSQGGGGAQATPIPLSTSKITAGINTPDQAILPSSTIAAWANASSAWGSNLQLPVPQPGNQFTGRIVISVGTPTQAQVVQSDGSIASPSSSNSTDPSTGTFYDFLEFTVTNSAAGVVSLDVDTSQVDAFGLPMTLQFFSDKHGQTPFNATFIGSTANNSATVTGISSSSFGSLQVGQVIVGPGIPPGTLINAVDPAGSSITLTNLATVTAAGVTLTVQNGGPVGVDGTLEEVVHGGNTNSFEHFLQQKIDAKYYGARPFLQSANPFEVAGGVPITGVTSSGALIITTDSTNGLNNGDLVSISGVVGATAANGVFTVANKTATSFELSGVTATQQYHGGGEWSFAITGATNPGANKEIVISATNTGSLQDGDLVEISGVVGNANANGFFFVKNVTPTSFELKDSDGGAATPYASGGTWRVYQSGHRLVSPKDVVESISDYKSTNQLNNYFNEAIDDFFLKYLPSNQSVSRNGQTYYGGGETFTIQSSASGTNITYSGVVKTIKGYGTVLYLTKPSTGTTTPPPYLIFYPFTNANRPSDYTPLFGTVPGPVWMKAAMQTQSASEMIFSCDGFFADNTFRAQKYGMTDEWSKVLGDLEDSISAAFNRGVALNDPATWGESQHWFQQNNGQKGKYNYWVEYWHHSGLTVNDLAYAFPYDDKYGTSTNLNVANVGLAKVTLNSWSATQSPTTTAFVGFPTIAQQQGAINLTANVGLNGGGVPAGGTVTFFIDGVPINSNDFSASPPWQPVPIDGSGVATISATLPALPDGSTTHTYTVTALYSGHGTSAPSVTYQSLKLVGVNGDFMMALSPNTGALGTSVTVTATLPGDVFNGTVTFSTSLSDGSQSQQLGAPVPVTSSALKANITVPGTLLSFTGDFSQGYDTISKISNAVNLSTGQTITSSYFSGATLVTGVTPPGLKLSHVAALTGKVTFMSNGVTFTGMATQGHDTLTGVNTLAGLTANVAITQVTGNSQVLAPNTTVLQLIHGSMTFQGLATGTATGATVVSDGYGMVFPITAHFTPLTGPSYTAFIGYATPPLH